MWQVCVKREKAIDAAEQRERDLEEDLKNKYFKRKVGGQLVTYYDRKPDNEEIDSWHCTTCKAINAIVDRYCSNIQCQEINSDRFLRPKRILKSIADTVPLDKRQDEKYMLEVYVQKWKEDITKSAPSAGLQIMKEDKW